MKSRVECREKSRTPSPMDFETPQHTQKPFGSSELLLVPNSRLLASLAQHNFHRQSVPFSALREPFAHRRCQARRINRQSRFEGTFAGRNRVVEFTRPGEIAHAKTVQPFQRDQLAFLSNDCFGLQFSRVHRPASISPPLGANARQADRADIAIGLSNFLQHPAEL